MLEEIVFRQNHRTLPGPTSKAVPSTSNFRWIEKNG